MQTFIKQSIKYEPFFDLSHLSKPNFVTSPHMSYFIENDEYDNGGKGDWGYSGLGLLHVYIENSDPNDPNDDHTRRNANIDPVLTIPLHLSKTLNLDRGRAWIGFTASTGDETYQVHDMLHFAFSSLRLD
jgi:hypothetical protein